MITASLILNILVLIPVCIGLIFDSDRVKKTAGEFTVGRGVLLALYSTILFASLILLFYTQYYFVFALLFMQVVYKLLSPITAKTIRNPIIISNIFIALFHFITIYVIIENGKIVF